MAINFKISKSTILGDVWIIKPSIAEDNRGNIWTSFLKDEIEKILPDDLYFKHDKFSKSKKSVLRGIHGDDKSWKLGTCVHGAIHQVVIDCRKESDTYTKYETFEINGDNQISILIPPRFGNAYFVRSKNTVYHYKLAYDGDYIDADEQFSYKWNEPLFNINWPIDEPILSIRDEK